MNYGCQTRPRTSHPLPRLTSAFLSCTLLWLAATAARATTNLPPAATGLHDYPVKPVPFTAVTLADEFWAPRIATNRLTTIPCAFAQCEKSGRMNNFERAARILHGQAETNLAAPGYPFDDTDPYKVLEGASYSLAVNSDDVMDKYVNQLIDLISSAQEPDGYLYTTRTINPQHPNRWSGPNRWEKEQELSHELYNAGHLFEAAAAHYQATGNTNLLAVALREADLLVHTFGPGPDQLHYWPGHEIVEMGLVRLYRATGNTNYLSLAKYYLDDRGSRPGGDDYHQSRLRPVEQTEAIGHAVRAGYLYSGMTDIAALTGDTRYGQAVDTIWSNCVGKKLYLTGGIGARANGEAFGDNYELPNLTAYCETCAAVANDYWNQRLFLLHGDARYVDVLERTLYNGLLSGVSLDGTKFFYPNPLESAGKQERSAWFGCACCPGNLTRFIASVPGYFYAESGDSLYVNLFATGSAETTLDNGITVKIIQATKYPWDGHVNMTILPEHISKFTVRVRIPGWAENQAVPGDLYTFLDPLKESVKLRVNGHRVSLKLDHGYAVLARTWHRGDELTLDLPMLVRRVVANPQVAADCHRVALQRGPIVFCAEWPDNPEGQVRNLILPDQSPLTASFDPNLLNGVEVITGQAARPAATGTNQTLQPFKAIPYFAWANRGKGEMAVWLANSPQAFKKP